MPGRSSRRPLTRRRLLIPAVLLVLVAGGVGTAQAWTARPAYASTEQSLIVLSGPDGDEPTRIDTTFYLPRGANTEHPVPAILLAHGFGGSKQSVTQDAEDFAERGYAVLAWSARGFGRSGGQIHLDSPEYEVRDAQRLLDWLAERPEVIRDGDGDPRVGVVGGSYGGALALMLAGADQRVDAIVPMITWNDLARSFLPEATGAGPAQGVFKKQWAGLFFTSGAALVSLAPATTGQPAAPESHLGDSSDTTLRDHECGRFAADVCAAYFDVATTGRPSPATIDLLHRSSPASTLSRVTAPTLLIQGLGDTLFPLSEAERNYRAIAATGTPVRMAWFTGGHDGGSGPSSDQDRLRDLTNSWLDHYVRGTGPDPGTSFTFSRVSGFDAETRRVTASAYRADTYPGTDIDTGAAAPTGPETGIPIYGWPQPVANPPGGNPAAVSSMPGADTSFSRYLGGVALDVPGQYASFASRPLADDLDVVGAPSVTIRAASPTGEAVLFLKLYDVDPSGNQSLPYGLVAPVRLTGLPADIDEARPVTVRLPGIVHRFEAGHRLHLAVATSDQAYATPAQPAVYTISLAGGDAVLHLPRLAATPIADPETAWRYALAALVALIVAGVASALAAARVRGRRAGARTRASAREDSGPSADLVPAEYAQTPLVVKGLRKEYGDGFLAAANVDLNVERGQVVGLLGPNGAGKTTTLRLLLGLTRPTRGEVLVFGQRLRPGAEVLTRVGALVEGPGFLPHLTGLANLRLYWRSTGRPYAQAHLDEVLAVAGLGDAIHRKVSKYSHGMRQRLAIAQAMLGLPELLILDEPTDGLDPPQIAQMRLVLRDYAKGGGSQETSRRETSSAQSPDRRSPGGRSVLVSSHLLAEVEQTCTHVAIMNRGEVVASGPVQEVIGDSAVARFDVSDPEVATSVLTALEGVESVAPAGDNGVLVVDLARTTRAEAVAALVRAGVGVNRVVPRRRLEDAFLALVDGSAAGGGSGSAGVTDSGGDRGDGGGDPGDSGGDPGDGGGSGRTSETVGSRP